MTSSHTESAPIYRCDCTEWDVDADAVKSMKNGYRYICGDCEHDVREVSSDEEKNHG